jgi:hypothetical protein
MQLANCLVAVGGDVGNTVPKYDVTAAEIAVLRAIHGEHAVIDIEPTRDIQRGNGEELGRIRANYGNARDTENNSIVNMLFPGAAARVFQTIDELGIPEEFFKPTSRATTQPLFGGKGDHDGDGKAGGAADPVDVPAGSVDDMTVAQLKAYAASAEIDLGEATKKADILAAIKAAEAKAEEPVEDADETEETDPVEDLGDAKTDDGLFQ